jgi:hypothetical protein
MMMMIIIIIIMMRTTPTGLLNSTTSSVRIGFEVLTAVIKGVESGCGVSYSF